MNRLKDNTARAKKIISIFWIMLGLTVVNIGSLVLRYIVVSDAQAERLNVDMSLIETSDNLILIINIALFIIAILTIVFFIMWFRRAYYNLHQLPWHNARYTDGWAAGSWFVPIIWWWWPYQIMMDIWKGTQNALRETLGEPRSAAIVGWWWTLYLISSIYNNFAVRAGWNAEDSIEGLLASTKLDIIGEIISIPAILIAVTLIQRTSVFERELLVHAETPNDSIFSDNYVAPREDATVKFEN